MKTPQLMLAAAMLLLTIAGRGQSPDTTVDIEEVVVVNSQQRRGIIEVIDSRMFSRFTGASGSFENILKVLPGVQSGNELSSQYAVRGGSFNDNLVYVNGVEIVRPMLTRTGQQEGLSFVNPQLVSSVEFSTGGFGAEFGDKMSSVLNVRYKRPTSVGGSAEASLLGASAAGHFALKEAKIGGAVGLRYKRASYLLGSLDTKGEYNPTFADIQTVLHYDLSRRLTLRFFGTYALNRYDFVPENRSTSFGTLTNPVTFMMYYEGSEHDAYSNTLGALTADYRPLETVNLNFTASSVQLREQETLDILSEYYLQAAQSPAARHNVEVGSLRDHARNYTSTFLYQLDHKGVWDNALGALKWGAAVQLYRVDDDVYQWQLVDSAGQMLPRSDEALLMSDFVSAANRVINQRYSGYVQQGVEVFFAGEQQLSFTPGVRFCYSAFNGEWLVSPRLQVVWHPRSAKKMELHAAAGLYQQPPFYKEMKDARAQVNSGLAAQKSVHLVLGGSSMFQFSGIPCKFTTEGYYKLLYDLVPYTQENVNLTYAGHNAARGYIYGLDMKLNAEMVPGAESWLSLSLMQARQDVAGDGAGYVPMPNDQLLNVSVMAQDRIFENPHWRAHLLLHYGSALPVFVPVENNYSRYFKMPSYKRVDMGFSYVFFEEQAAMRVPRVVSFLKSCTLTVEVLNLFNMVNTASYLWVQTADSNAAQMVAVPNYLTPRRFNARLAISF